MGHRDRLQERSVPVHSFYHEEALENDAAHVVPSAPHAMLLVVMVPPTGFVTVSRCPVFHGSHNHTPTATVAKATGIATARNWVCRDHFRGAQREAGPAHSGCDVGRCRHKRVEECDVGAVRAQCHAQ